MDNWSKENFVQEVWRLGPGFLSCCFLQILIKELTTEKYIYE
jgi:hypothetical protein